MFKPFRICTSLETTAGTKKKIVNTLDPVFKCISESSDFEKGSFLFELKPICDAISQNTLKNIPDYDVRYLKTLNDKVTYVLIEPRKSLRRWSDGDVMY